MHFCALHHQSCFHMPGLQTSDLIVSVSHTVSYYFRPCEMTHSGQSRSLKMPRLVRSWSNHLSNARTTITIKSVWKYRVQIVLTTALPQFPASFTRGWTGRWSSHIHFHYICAKKSQRLGHTSVVCYCCLSGLQVPSARWQRKWFQTSTGNKAFFQEASAGRFIVVEMTEKTLGESTRGRKQEKGSIDSYDGEMGWRGKDCTDLPGSRVKPSIPCWKTNLVYIPKTFIT